MILEEVRTLPSSAAKKVSGASAAAADEPKQPAIAGDDEITLLAIGKLLREARKGARRQSFDYRLDGIPPDTTSSIRWITSAMTAPVALAQGREWALVLRSLFATPAASGSPS